MSVTPETLTFEDIKKWTPLEMREQMRHSDMREAITRVVSSQSLDAVLDADKASKEAEQVTAPETPEQLAERIAAAEAEQARLVEQQRLAVEQEEAARKLAEAPKKIVVEYQVKDEDGSPIGRPTHLEAATEEEMRGKIIEAHIQATRAFHRLKKQKITFKDTQPVAPSTDTDLLAAMADLRSEDPNKQLAALRKVQQAESDKLRAEELEQKRQAKVSQDFLKAHKEDFYNCQANIELIKEYFEQNPELNWTYDNLELAFLAVEPKLAPVPQPEPVAFVAPVNPQPAAPVVPVVQQPVQAVVPTPTVAAPATNTPAPAPRPGVNGGLVPGESSASRPVATKSTGLTAEEIKSWSPATMRANMRNPAKRAQIDAFFAARNQARK